MWRHHSPPKCCCVEVQAYTLSLCSETASGPVLGAGKCLAVWGQGGVWHINLHLFLLFSRPCGQGACDRGHAPSSDGAGGDAEPDGAGLGGKASPHPGALQR